MAETTDNFLREPEVLRRSGASHVTLYRWEAAGTFPKRRQIGPNTVGWLESEVAEWQKSRPTSSIPPVKERVAKHKRAQESANAAA